MTDDEIVIPASPASPSVRVVHPWECNMSCRPVVLVMQAAEHRAADDRGRNARLRLRLPAVGRVESERPVRALRVTRRGQPHVSLADQRLIFIDRWRSLAAEVAAV